MKLLIAHRGLMDGPDKNKENHPDQIISAISQGYNCEIDLWCKNCSSGPKYFLGHDEPTYEIEEPFLMDQHLWIHAKNLDALYMLTSHLSNLNYFWHQEDNFTLTSKGYIWTYPSQPLTTRSIQVMPEWNDPKFENLDCRIPYGICSDYVNLIKSKISSTIRI
jgi:hypothetical protein